MKCETRDRDKFTPEMLAERIGKDFVDTIFQNLRTSQVEKYLDQSVPTPGLIRALAGFLGKHGLIDADQARQIGEKAVKRQQEQLIDKMLFTRSDFSKRRLFADRLNFTPADQEWVRKTIGGATPDFMNPRQQLEMKEQVVKELNEMPLEGMVGQLGDPKTAARVLLALESTKSTSLLDKVRSAVDVVRDTNPDLAKQLSDRLDKIAGGEQVYGYRQSGSQLIPESEGSGFTNPQQQAEMADQIMRELNEMPVDGIVGQLSNPDTAIRVMAAVENLGISAASSPLTGKVRRAISTVQATNPDLARQLTERLEKLTG